MISATGNMLLGYTAQCQSIEPAQPRKRATARDRPRLPRQRTTQPGADRRDETLLLAEQDVVWEIAFHR